MAIQSYALTPGGTEKFKGDIIKAAMVTERLSKVGRQIRMPKNSSKTYVARKWVPYNATATKALHNQFFPTGTAQVGVDRGQAVIDANKSVEGVTPSPDSITPLDYTAILQEYSCLYGFTNQTADLYEDDIPQAMKDQIGQRITLVNEMIVYGALQGCTNVYYGGTGTSIATVNAVLTLNLIRKIVRNLQANHAMPITNVLKASGNYGTDPVQEAYLVYVHTDLEPDVRGLAGFTPTEKYASGTPIEGEIGKVERFRFIGCPDLPARISAGASTGTYTTLQTSTATTNADVFPIIIMGENAFSQIALRGRESVDPTYIPPGEKSKSDPLGQRGFYGALWYKATLIENDNWMAVAYVGTTAL